MRHLVNRTAILSQNHRKRDKMLHACMHAHHVAPRALPNRGIVQRQNLIFGRFPIFFFYPNETWTHPPTSKLFLDFWNFFNFAKPLNPHENNDVDSIIGDLHEHIELIHGFVKVDTDTLAEKHVTNKFKYANFTEQYYGVPSYSSKVV